MRILSYFSRRLRAVSFCILLVMLLPVDLHADPLASLLVPSGEVQSDISSLPTVGLSRVTLMTFSHRGELLATAEDDGRVCIWGMADRRPLRCLPDSKGRKVTALSFDPLDQWIALGFPDGSVELHGARNLRGGEPCKLSALPVTLALGRSTAALMIGSVGQDFGSVFSIGSKGGTLLKWPRVLRAESAACHADKQATPEKLPALNGLPTGLFEHVVFTPRGDRVVISIGNAVGAWEVSSGVKLWLHENLPDMIVSLAISPDGTQVATGALDGSLSLFDVLSGEQRSMPSPHLKRIRGLAFSPDGKTLVASADDRQLSVWTLPAGADFSLLSTGAVVTALQFHPVGQTRELLAGAVFEQGVAFWERLPGGSFEPIAQALRGNADPIRTIAFAQKGSLLATGSDDRVVRIWQRDADGRTWRLRCKSKPQKGVVRSLAFRPPLEAQLAAVVDGRRIRLFPTQNSAGDTCEEEPSIEADNLDGGPFQSIAFSADGKWLAAGSTDGTVIIFDPVQKKQRNLLSDSPRDGISTLAFHPSQPKTLAAASHDKTIRLWNVETATVEHLFEPQSAGVHSLAFSPDGTKLAMGAGPELSLWNLSDYKKIAKRTAGDIRGAVFLSDNRRIVIGEKSGQIVVWDAFKQKDEQVLSPPGSPNRDLDLFALALDPAGGAVVSAGKGRILFRLLGPGLPLHSVLWAGAPGWATWVRQDEKTGTLLRHETGGLLWSRDESGLIQPLAPPPNQHKPELKLEFEIGPNINPWEPGIAHILVRNLPGAGPALWVRIRQSSSADGVLPQASVTLPPTLMRLEADSKEPASWELPIGLTPRLIPPWMTAELCLTVTAQDETESSPVCRKIVVGPWWWRQSPWLLLGVLGIAALLVVRRWIVRLRPQSDPSIARTHAKRNPLSGRRLHEFPAIEHALRQEEEVRKRPGFRSRALSLAGLDAQRWQRALVAADSPASCARQLAECLLATIEPLVFQDKEVTTTIVFRVTLPPLSLYIGEDAVLIVCTSKSSPPQSGISEFSRAQLCRPRFALIVDLTETFTSPESIRQALQAVHQGTIFVILSELTVREILFSENSERAKDILRETIVSQCDTEHITPYRSEGVGIADEFSQSFMGRQKELSLLLDRFRQNFLLVGPRRMGKSSLLNALRRAMMNRYPEVQVLKYQFSNGSLDKIRALDKRLRADTPGAFHDSVLARSSAHQLFLLDEADAFIDQESKTQYEFCHVMRALSGQGRASFVLTGYRQLHDAVRTADHPLRNFGELLRLGPLDLESAERMIVEPLSAFGLRFADVAATVDWLRSETACRPHLLVYACSAILRLRTPLGAPPIELSEVQRAVYESAAILDDFGNWDSQKGQQLQDVVVMRAVLLLQRASLEQLAVSLEKQGLTLSLATITASVHRLYDFHYALVRDVDGSVYCPLPLLQQYLRGVSASDLPIGSDDTRMLDLLARDIAALKQECVS